MKNKDIFKKEIFNIEPRIREYVINNLKNYLKKKSKFKLKFNPRLKKLKTHHHYNIFLVDGELIRNKLDIDFVMGGNGFRYLYIPVNEIWIDDAYKNSKEINYIILHEFIELNLMRHGINYSKAHDLASVKELKERRK
ncbi:MAG: hypothetical protein AABX61_02250 [Nanoarchaeota archaeon]